MIPTPSVKTAWPVFGPMVEMAVERYGADRDVEGVKADILAERSALFGVFVDGEPKAAIVIHPAVYQKRKTLVLDLVGGSDIEQWWKDAIRDIVSQAKSAGYGAIEAKGRKGWAKIAKQCNFKEAYVAYELEI
jgi:hypothetical protein